MPGTQQESGVVSRGERTRQAILESAERLFLSKGYNGTSMRQIARRAGNLAVSGIYNHFQNKEEIFQALLEARSPYRQIVHSLENLDAESGPAMLQKAFRELDAILLENLEFVGLVLIDYQELGGRTIRTLANTMIPPMVIFGQRLQDASGIRDDLNVFVLIRSFAMVMIGYTVTQLIAFSGDRLELPDAPAIEDLDWKSALVDVMLHGFVGENDHNQADRAN